MHILTYMICCVHWEINPKFLSFGDPAASLFGAMAAKAAAKGGQPSKIAKVLATQIGGGPKTLAGTGTCAVVCAMVTHFYLDSFANATTGARAGTVLWCGMAGAIAEVLPVGIDDNLSMPVLSALLAYPAWRWAEA